MFTPATLNVTVGTTVTFLNDDVKEHKIVPDANTLFTGTAVISPLASATITFSQSGPARYKCELVPAMTGTVNVTPAAP
ncbi:MAG: hypothetical protein VKS61_03145 [Candidatus Sericytochromatia bacterium]|nr:hypothetical protein [Candidatus Sericytochromatia bacterium]